ncbi:F510_1955 family glycosylhydrolase [Bacillus sp. DJP31]|uniref:F510_1955 family glycosylhydrolase n=1 Tax=Bacillus sp. DJP31 TaxID=3409789 RepID=UPI003BB48A1C
MSKYLLFIVIIVILMITTACGNNEGTTPEEDKVDSENVDKSALMSTDDFYEPFTGKLEHVHGLGYAGNKDAIYFASHDGLKVYQDGKWYRTKENNNDYMGFNAVDKGFYTSGHPGDGVNLTNPLGVSRSYDNGQSIENLDFEGESDFHAMGVGYESHTVYILNEQKNSKMDIGLYSSQDDGETWEKKEASNLGEQIFSLAVHPTDSNMVAAASQEGIYQSKDGGQSFSLLTNGKQGTSVFLSEDSLWYGAFGEESVLVKHSISDGKEQQMDLPEMKEDAVMYVAQNPLNAEEFVFITFKGNVYLSSDGATTWNELVKEGILQ